MGRDTKDTAIYIAYEELDAFDVAVPEKNLLKAVLLNAVYDLKRGGNNARRATEYFLNPHEDYIFSFQSICNFLEIDPERILVITGLKPGADVAPSSDGKESPVPQALDLKECVKALLNEVGEEL